MSKKVSISVKSDTKQVEEAKQHPVIAPKVLVSIIETLQDDTKLKETEVLNHKTQILKDSKMLEAYEYFLRKLCKDGFPNGNIFEYAALQIQTFDNKRKAEISKKAAIKNSLDAKDNESAKITQSDRIQEESKNSSPEREVQQGDKKNKMKASLAQKETKKDDDKLKPKMVDGQKEQAKASENDKAQQEQEKEKKKEVTKMKSSKKQK